MTLPVDIQSFRKHAVIIGASGSGKTVTAKHVIEELVLSGVKVIAIDPQGDVASMALASSDPNWSRVRKRVYTPASDAGMTLSLNPLNVRSDSSSRMIPAVAANVAGILGYDTRNAEGRSVVAALDQTLLTANGSITSIDALIRALKAHVGDRSVNDQLLAENAVMRNNAREARRHGFDVPDPEPVRPTAATNALEYICSTKHLNELIRRLSQLATGTSRELYCTGRPITMDELTSSDLSVVYLNTLYGASEKVAVVSQIATTLYDWMLKHPSPNLQVVLYIDEIAQFLPAGNKNTSAKEALRLLFKQGRKYGVGIILATQSPGDADYKAMSQAGTWMIGRLSMRQDINKVKPLYANLPDRGMKDSVSGELSGEAVSDLPHMDVGQFQVISPDNFTGIRVLRFPMPRTPHETLDEYALERVK